MSGGSAACPTQVTFDSLGRATELKEFTTASTSGSYTSTQYKFNRRSQHTEIWDSAANKWTYKYDIRGRLIESTDPDEGKSRISYNDNGDVVYTETNINPATGQPGRRRHHVRPHRQPPAHLLRAGRFGAGAGAQLR